LHIELFIMKTTLFLILIIYSFPSFSQEKNSLLIKHPPTNKDTLFKPNYPEGIYISKEDFINKKPNYVKDIIPKNIYGKKKAILDTIVHACYFYDAKTDKKIKKVFAISYKGYLYFQLYSILKNRNKLDRAQATNFPNSFVRVIDGGKNYYYTEANLTNQWAKGLAYNLGALGGAIGNTMIYGKGVVWDFKNKEFNIFRNCKDYNEFIQRVYPEGKQICKKQPDMLKVREAVLHFK